jgi:hypothetical protein
MEEVLCSLPLLHYLSISQITFDSCILNQIPAARGRVDSKKSPTCSKYMLVSRYILLAIHVRASQQR